MKTFTCTDPGNYQYGKKIDEFNYQFKEFNRYLYPTVYSNLKADKNNIENFFDHNRYWIEEVINLKDYSNEQIQNYISTYGYNLISIDEQLGEQSNWIIAECIFEQESGLY